MKVLVTGAGGPAGVAVLRQLRRTGIAAVAADCDPDAVGLRLVDESVVLPRCDDPSFTEELTTAAATSGTDVLISTVAEELLVLTERPEILATARLASWLPSHDAVRACVDKALFAERLAAAQVPIPATADDPHLIEGPWILKPRFGRGSRGVVAVHDPDELDVLWRRIDDPIAQHLIAGEEFTADVLVDKDRTVLGCVPRWRLETKAGISTKGETFDSAAVDDVVGQALRAVDLDGPACVQGFVEPDGAVTIIEINPRFSGGLPLSLHAGADLVGAYLDGILGRPIDPARLRHRSGVKMLRHFDEVFEG